MHAPCALLVFGFRSWQNCIEIESFGNKAMYVALSQSQYEQLHNPRICYRKLKNNIRKPLDLADEKKAQVQN